MDMIINSFEKRYEIHDTDFLYIILIYFLIYSEIFPSIALNKEFKIISPFTSVMKLNAFQIK